MMALFDVEEDAPALVATVRQWSNVLLANYLDENTPPLLHTEEAMLMHMSAMKVAIERLRAIED